MMHEKVKSAKGKKLEARCRQEYQSKEVRCSENTLGAERVFYQLVLCKIIEYSQENSGLRGLKPLKIRGAFGTAEVPFPQKAARQKRGQKRG
jgi:hypothetical protein